MLGAPKNAKANNMATGLVGNQGPMIIHAAGAVTPKPKSTQSKSLITTVPTLRNRSGPSDGPAFGRWPFTPPGHVKRIGFRPEKSTEPLVGMTPHQCFQA
jgi:hypothetical protein